MTLKEERRRLTTALHEQRAAQEEVRETNALVVKATSKLPPHYVYEHLRFAPGEREQIQKLIDRAQRASVRLANATADVVNLRGLMMNDSSQRGKKKAPAGNRHHATKKSAAQLQRKTPHKGYYVRVGGKLYGARTKQAQIEIRREKLAHAPITHWDGFEWHDTGKVLYPDIAAQQDSNVHSRVEVLHSETPGKPQIAARKIDDRWQPVTASGVIIRGNVYNADGTGYGTKQGAEEAAAMIRKLGKSA